MFTPTKYVLEGKSPFESFNQGYEASLKNRANEAILNANEQKAILENLKAQKELQARATLNNFAQIKNPTNEDYAAIIAANPDIAAGLKQSFDIYDSGRRESLINKTAKAYSAIRAGRPDIASKLLNNYAEAYKNNGMNEEAQQFQDAARLIDLNPDLSEKTAGLLLYSNLGPSKFSATFSDLTNATLNEEKARADIKNVESTIKERDYKPFLQEQKSNYDMMLEEKKMAYDESKLDAPSKKIINDSIESSMNYKRDANIMNDLASKLEAYKPSSGLAGKASETLKSLTGTQDFITGLRKQYTQLRNSEAIKLLPPGAASNQDVKFTLDGFLPETASPKQIASWLRGHSILNDQKATYEEAKADWISKNGNMGRAKKDTEINGIAIEPGMSFADYYKYSLTKDYGSQQQSDIQINKTAPANLKGKSYEQFAK